MRQHGRRDFLNVVGQDEIVALDCRQRLRCAENRHRRAGAASQHDGSVFTGRTNELQEVIAHFGIDVYLADRLLAGDHFLRRHRRLERLDRMAVLQPVEHLAFFFESGIAQAQADQKAIELRFGQRKRAFVIDGILRGDDQERRFEL